MGIKRKNSIREAETEHQLVWNSKLYIMNIYCIKHSEKYRAGIKKLKHSLGVTEKDIYCLANNL